MDEYINISIRGLGEALCEREKPSLIDEDFCSAEREGERQEEETDMVQRI